MQLRSMWGLSEDVFWASLCDEELEGGAPEAAGKSGSLFWYSADRLFVIKSISRSELRTLVDGLDGYAQHFAANRNSLICRFFGAFDMKHERQRLTLVVMNNVFCTARFKPHWIYDLKGTTEDRWVNPRPGVVLKDLNFADKIIGIADFRHKVELLHALKKDTRFLRGWRVMDYSVALGVHYCEDDSRPRGEQLVPQPGIASPLAVLRGFEPHYQCTLVRDQAARRVVYHIGIIDIMQSYDVRKCLAHAVKSMSLGWVHEIDTAPPDYYARRFKTSLLGKVQTFREPGDRVARFVHRLQTGIDNGTIPRPTFAVPRGQASPAEEATQPDTSENDSLVASVSPLPMARLSLVAGLLQGGSEEVTMDESVDFAVRCGGHLQLLRGTGGLKGLLRSQPEEVEAFLDMDRHALVFQVMSRGLFGQKRPTSAVACYKIRRVYLSLTNHRPSDRYCIACKTPIKVEAEPAESRRFTVEADDAPLRCTAPSRRQAKLWVTALEVAAAYAEANVEDVEEVTSAAVAAARSQGDAVADVQQQPALSSAASAFLGSAEGYLSEAEVGVMLLAARSVRLGPLEPYLTGPEAERRWEKRRVKWIFGFVDTDGTGSLGLPKVKALWREMNINDAEGLEVLSRYMREAREGRRARGGRQIGAGRVVQLADFRRMLRYIDSAHGKVVLGFVNRLASADGRHSLEDCVPIESIVRLFTEVQRITPAPSVSQVRRLLANLLPPLVTKNKCLSPVGLAHLLCSRGNALMDPAKRPVFQDMTRPLAAYFVETSHNTYLEGNQLSSRSSVLRYVEVLRTGCRSVEVDVWDGAEGEPVVKHGYSVTTEVLFEDVIQAIADHAFVASEYPVIISVEQHCSALQRIRQGDILVRVLGSRLLMPPWDEERGSIDFDRFGVVSPWAARGRFLVKSALGCCERCNRPLPSYDRCVALPTKKLLSREKTEIRQPGGPELGPSESPRGCCPVDLDARWHCHVSSMTASKVLKLRHSAGEDSLRVWNSQYLQRAYPEGTRIASGNVDPLPLWSCGVQMVAMNYQTPDAGLLMNEGLFRSYNGGCGYVLKPPELAGGCCHGARPGCRRRGSVLRLVVCCGHRLPRPEAPLGNDEAGLAAAWGAAVSSPLVAVGLEPGGQVSQTPAVTCDGYRPVFNHEVGFHVSDSPLHILTFEVRDSPTGRPMARRAVNLDAVREGFRWLPLHSRSGTTIPHSGLLVFVQFLAG